MFSPRLVAVFALIATVAAAPSESYPKPVTTITDDDLDTRDPWFPFGGFGGFGSFQSLFAPLFQWFPSLTEVGPSIESDDDNFRVIIDVKDYKIDDLKVKCKNGFILVSGSHESKGPGQDFATQFFHSYSLPQNASASAVTATLYSNNKLVVDAPNSGTTSEADDTLEREVPIVVSDQPYGKKPANPSETPVDKEPTTAATATVDREEVTENSNVIPHGSENEIQP